MGPDSLPVCRCGNHGAVHCHDPVRFRDHGCFPPLARRMPTPGFRPFHIRDQSAGSPGCKVLASKSKSQDWFPLSHGHVGHDARPFTFGVFGLRERICSAVFGILRVLSGLSPLLLAASAGASAGWWARRNSNPKPSGYELLVRFGSSPSVASRANHLFRWAPATQILRRSLTVGRFEQ